MTPTQAIIRQAFTVVIFLLMVRMAWVWAAPLVQAGYWFGAALVAFVCWIVWSIIK